MNQREKTMSDDAFLHQKLDSLREELTKLHQKEDRLKELQQDVLQEILMVRREIHLNTVDRMARAKKIAENIPPEFT
jgi:uncharacterized protein YciW